MSFSKRKSLFIIWATLYNFYFLSVCRSANYTKPGQYVKCFHNPEKVLILHNHFPLGCLGGVCTSNPVNTTMAQVHSSPEI